MCLPDYRTLSDLTDEELLEVCRIYDIGELLSSEEDIDYLMARLPDRFVERPRLVNYSFTEKELEFLRKLKEEAIAAGLDMEEEF
jgi:hypothetical protein